MKQINKKAAANVGALTTAKKYNLKRASKIIGISYTDFIEFLLLRKYIKAEKNGYSATGMGVEFGYTINKHKKVYITFACITKVSRAFNIH